MEDKLTPDLIVKLFEFLIMKIDENLQFVSRKSPVMDFFQSLNSSAAFIIHIWFNKTHAMRL